ncbi:coatomer delta subunit Ret2 [Schizosaccharomyces octosporus yFS286]|uniref:Coatomer subunit delta n=1 Tax=Schizosaccharomyces octosporus (strain yFS286) TaxID=483514 RepID=S9Q0I7_SCHOY|nr:coatomer delta subunit Ret2 [Schizosaccharomyces octosporus yFS286]EPX73712.1 coatomer delta subunit Ret2 [Schizosaccharomyces octosporus yFS286]
MVVLAASIVNRGGKAIISRQFREMSRARVESLLSSFPGLVSGKSQNTTVETENVRFVYQPFDELYMVLTTNLQSNILQDIDTLHLLSQALTSICPSSDEREILEYAFEIFIAFDEVTSLGYRDNVTLPQVKMYLEMESHEEKIQEIVSRNKELEATEERKRRIRQLEMQKKDAKRGGLHPSSDLYESVGYQTVNTTMAANAEEESAMESYRSAANAASAPRAKGMQLGKKKTTTPTF